MDWAFTIGRVAGTKIRIHYTFLIFLIIIAVQAYFEHGGFEAAFRAVGLLVGIFFCVLLHEFGHVFAGLKFGITTPKVTLLPIGGVAQISKIPKEPKQELFIALAGPMVNVVIALLLMAIRGGIPAFTFYPSLTSGASLIDGLIWVNIVLVAFNMLPAFPLDGGRAFRALLAMFTSRLTATHWAVTLGQVLAIGGAIFAFTNGHIILAIIALFIFFAGKGEEIMVDQEALLEGHTADEAGMSDYKALSMDDTLAETVRLVLDSDHDVFPVINSEADCIAAVSFEEILTALQHSGPEALVKDAVDSIPEQIKWDTPAFDAFQTLARSRVAGAAVVDEKGQLSKWLTLRQFREFIAVQTLAKQGIHVV